MENNNANLNPDNSTTENQSSPVVQADETAETSLSLRRSPRVKRPRIPCGCCTTGMHVRTFTNIMGRRPLHTPSATAAQRSVKRKRVSRINPTTPAETGAEAEAIERPSTQTPRDRNNVGVSKRLGSIGRRRPIFAAATGRRVEECGEISFEATPTQTSGNSNNSGELPSVQVLPTKRLCLPPIPTDVAEDVEVATTALGPRSAQSVSLNMNLTVNIFSAFRNAATQTAIDNNQSTPIDAVDLQENADTQATANTSAVEDKKNDTFLIPFAEIKSEPESQAPSVFGDEDSNTIVNSTLLSTCKEESFTLPRPKEYYRQNPPSLEQSSSDEEDEADEEDEEDEEDKEDEENAEKSPESTIGFE
ncbi:uncharacterized protein LOC133845417 isoform X2 [Drosophila sulfurigaster albostrigata]|uniref:uncharacterized protein LOC133845417 isoform X2 n=1 Tax=Drosophila sulfurigaster albostrigata TaxID=89887 RepID=UPI002D21DF5D|nr:uncharacterized protein LOC133845417 isoform X2 [Drosophila sulfurigaster albostrigata]